MDATMGTVEAVFALLGVVLLMIGHAELRFRWMREENTKAHKAIGENIDSLRTDLKDDIGALDGRIGDLRTELKTEIGDLRTELKTEIGDLRTELKTEITEVRTELKAEITEVRTELKAEITEVRTELKAEIGEVRTELKTEIAEGRTATRNLQRQFADLATQMGATSGKVDLLVRWATTGTKQDRDDRPPAS